MGDILETATAKTPFLFIYRKWYDAKYVKTIDGDTVHLVIKFRDDFICKCSCRVQGYDAPEKGDDGYTEYKKQLATCFAENKMCRVKILAIDNYKRYITIIKNESGIINDKMIRFDDNHQENDEE